MNFIKELKNIDIFEMGFNRYFSKKENVSIKFYKECLVIMDLENAMKTGKEVNKYVLTKGFNNDNFKVDFFNYLNEVNFNISDFVQYLLNGYIIDSDNLNIRIDKIKGVRVFNPYYEAKPIIEPNKWTIAHVCKSILSGQISYGQCKGQYTDDYFHDASVNFNKGKTIDILELCEELTEEPSGWKVTKEDKKENDLIVLNVSCHNFKHHKLYFNKDGNNKIIQFEDNEVISNVINMAEYKIKKSL